MSFQQITQQNVMMLNESLECLCVCDLECGACRDHVCTVQMFDEK
jgi:hypothetical protein